MNERAIWTSHFWFENGIVGRYSREALNCPGAERYTGSSTVPEYMSVLPSSLSSKRSVSFFFVLLGSAAARPLR